MADRLRLEDDMKTHPGCVRAANEDSAVSMPRDSIWAVADGMGGHANGQHASQTLARMIGGVSASDDLSSACKMVADAIHAANAEIFAEAQTRGEQMGSTIVALVMRDREFAVLWAGDSRAYLYRDSVLHQLTNDHTQVQEMVDRGLLSPAEAADHPMSHVLARAVGVRPMLELDAISDTARPGDIFLLCSDGMYGVVSNDEVAAILAEAGRRSIETLVELCLERGAPDNVTVILVSAHEPTALAFATSMEGQ
jgi:serine/threonine protein phosphatase Stp1